MLFFDAHSHNLVSHKKVVTIFNTYPNKLHTTHYFSVGLHPWFIKKDNVLEDIANLETAVQHPNCLAVGECGLDKAIKTDFLFQEQLFKRQILLSEKVTKPLIIHCVRAYQEIIRIKKELNVHQPWIIHGFNKNNQVAQSLLKNGVFLSFGSSIIHNKKLQEVFKKVPLDAFLLETDTSTTSIQEIYRTAATLKKMSLAELQQILTENFTKIFTL
ncbi:TatD family hydrolase [Polaribacter tangerinus]|uniref:TatD family hydrolase n=1 Tax=Polaribacter tangerinus TaxID=1920034 RepID=UPI000B4C1A97|nr:TatD family hydrolase [Polaribacter tangerinus]